LHCPNYPLLHFLRFPSLPFPPITPDPTGLIYFSNKLKADTYPRTIQSLRDADIHVNMITGDHFHTAAAIAADCNILSKERGRVFLVDVPHGVEVSCDTRPVVLDAATEQVLQGMTVGQLIDNYYGGGKRLQAGLPAAAEAMGGDNNDEDADDVENRSFAVPFQVVVTGAGFQAVRNTTPDLLEPLCRIVNVFARMKPADKKHVVEEIMKPNSRYVRPS
jgi:magnesium-transporting ATPase (P-type)